MYLIKTLVDLEHSGVITLGRGKIISKKDLENQPGSYPVYSSSKIGTGKFGEYGRFMFDEELITWSVDGGGKLFHRGKHKFSITNVTGFLRILKPDVLQYKYLFYVLSYLHSKVSFDWVKKAHPSVLRKMYTHIPILPLAEQQRIVAKLDAAFGEIDKIIEQIEQKICHAKLLAQKVIDGNIGIENSDTLQATLGDICKIKHGFAFDGKSFSLSDDERRPIVLTPGNFSEKGAIIFNQRNTKRLQIEYDKKLLFSLNDLVVVMTDLSSKMLLLGKPALIKQSNILHNQRIGLVQNDEQVIINEYLYYYFQTTNYLREIKKTASGTMVRHTAPKRILSNTIKAPKSLSQQHNISQKIRLLLSESENLVDIYRKKRSNLISLKSAILTQELNPSKTA